MKIRTRWMNPFQSQFGRIIFAIVVTGLLLVAGSSWAQIGPYNAPTNTPLASWSFPDPTNWVDDQGHFPASFTNLNYSNLGNGQSLVVDTNVPAWLQYRVYETDGSTNLTVDSGSLTFWFAPNWASADTNANGTGPGDWAQLIDVGDWTTNGSTGYWGLSVDPGGTNLWFESEDGAGHVYTLSTPISWTTNYFHFIALTYASTNVSLYLDGQLATNDTGGLSVLLTSAALSNGVFFGSASGTNGSMQAHGLFDLVATYDYPLNSNDVATIFNWYYSSYVIDPYNIAYMQETASDSYQSLTNSTNLWVNPVNMNISNSLASMFLMNSIADVYYEIQGTTNLTHPNWTSLGFVYGSEITNLTLASVMVTNKPTLFLRIRSWQDDGSGLPIWWQEQYFGVPSGVDPYGDPMGDGWNNLEKFQLGMNPFQFYTPPAPQGLTANFDSYNNTATVTWQSSPGAVTGYMVEKDDSSLGTVQYVSIPVDQTSFVDNVATNLYLSDLGNTLSVSYKVQGLYGTNTSYWGGPVQLQQNMLQASFIAGPQGSAYVAVPSVPAGTAALRVTRVDESTWDSTNFDIPIDASTNGLYLIPSSWDVMQPDIYGNSQSYDWSVETLNTNGVPGASTTFYRAYNFLTEDDRAWLMPPYFDGRAQLKQNLIFLLRAGVVDSPFNYIGIGYYYGTNNGVFSTYFSNPANYVYAGFYQLDEDANGGGTYEEGKSFDVYWPFENNYRYRNFVFNSSELDVDGRTITGAGGNYFQNYAFGNYYSGGLMMEYPPAYQFQAPATNGASIPALLATNQTQWLASYALDSVANYLDEMGITTNVGGTYSMASNARNIYGLPFLSADIGYNAGSSAGVTTLYAGGNTAQGGYFYPQTAQPQLQTTQYNFWQGHSLLFGYSGTSLPGMTNFSTSQPSDLFVVGVDNSVMVNGYAKLTLLNGYSGVYGYLGQYFDNAYQIDENGNVTTNTTGVLSPYGQFFATQPGPTALVTMPDVDTGQRGTCTVYCVSLALDANHDGTMDLSWNGQDTTSPANPYLFWCNNNYDRWDGDGLFATDEQDDVLPSNPDSIGQDFDPYEPDCNYKDINDHRAIPDTRDLEDFARLWVCGITSGLVSNLPPDSTITLSWGDVGNPNPNNPTIDIFKAADPTGGIGYLTNEATANSQIGSGYYVQRIGPGQAIQKPAAYFESGNGLDHLIWCGVSNGMGQLTLTIADVNSNVLAQASQWIQIVDIKQMYERWTVGDNPNVAPFSAPTNAVNDLPTNVMQQPFTYSANTISNTPYILFVHGYALETWEKDRFAETMFKRLYWQGYQGRFGEFRWPTESNPLFFDNSESQAWKSGAGLLNLLTKLNAEYPNNVYLFAHSLGNVAAGEALRLAGSNQVVNTYIAAQAAVDSHTYDPTTPMRSGSFSTPDRYGQYYTDGATNYFNGTQGAGTYVNFFNTNDWALTTAWPPDETIKPDAGYGHSSTYDTWWQVGTFTNTPLVFPQDTYTIFSRCDQAHAFALGSQQNVSGAFEKGTNYNQIELDIAPYNFGPQHIYHSGQFRSDYAQRWQFWQEVLTSMKLFQIR